MWIALARGGAVVGLLAAAVALGGATRAAGDTTPSVSSYYLGRGDPRACPSPICGGVWVRVVNKALTSCGGGRGVGRHECYVAEVDVTHLRTSDQARTKLAGLVAGGRALARGTLVRGLVEGFPELATLVASEVWPASSSPREPDGPFRLLRDNGVRCVTTPCFSTHAALLNSGAHANVSRVGLAGTGTPAAERRRALNQLIAVGLIAAGRIVREPNAGPAGAGRVFVTTQFYVRAAAS
jgi:hypothetical protein